MKSAIRECLILDLGSHSAKSYLRGEGVREVGNVTWALLESPELGDPEARIVRSVQELVDPFRDVTGSILAIGTEAMRRSAALETRVARVCAELGVAYRTLTQAEEAALIRRAFADGSRNPREGTSAMDLVNVGGGSIQVISGPEGEMSLLGFGISDLNREFNLNGFPEARRVQACVDWVAARLPQGLAEFTYTGGEERYLRHWGVRIADGRCARRDFEALAARMLGETIERLETRSPYGPRWMRGAIASNCVVLAGLRVAGADYFVPSDKNIVHGLIEQLG